MSAAPRSHQRPSDAVRLLADEKVPLPSVKVLEATGHDVIAMA